MDRKQIIMNFTLPPSRDDLAVMAAAIIEAIPEELAEFCEGLSVVVEDFPDEALESELELEDAYELLALFRSGKELSPGVESKTAAEDDVLLLFRRPILDMWCESEDELNGLIRHIIIEEIGKNHDFSDDEVEEMGQRHYQGML